MSSHTVHSGHEHNDADGVSTRFQYLHITIISIYTDIQQCRYTPCILGTKETRQMGISLLHVRFGEGMRFGSILDLSNLILIVPPSVLARVHNHIIEDLDQADYITGEFSRKLYGVETPCLAYVGGGRSLVTTCQLLIVFILESTTSSPPTPPFPTARAIPPLPSPSPATTSTTLRTVHGRHHAHGPQRPQPRCPARPYLPPPLLIN